MKKITLIVLTMILAMGMILTACGKEEFRLGGTTDGKVTITAEKASKDSFATTGSVVVGDSGTAVIEFDFPEGEVQIQMMRQADEQSADMDMDEVKGMGDTENADVDQVIKGSGTREFEVQPGDYLVKATVVEKLTGTATISGAE